MIAALIVTLLPPVLIGYLVVKSLTPALKPAWAGVILSASLGTGAGVALLSILYFLVWLAIGPSIAAYWICEILLLCTAAAVYRFSRDSETVGSDSVRRGWLWLLAAGVFTAIAIELVLFVRTSASAPYGGWDAWAIWNLRAKFLAQHDATWRSAFSPLLSQLPGGAGTHADYPLLLSGYVARCWSLTNSAGDVVSPISVAALFSLATVGLVVAGLSIMRSWSMGMIGALILLSNAGFLLNGPLQYADVPLGFFFLATMVLFFLADAARSGPGCVTALAGFALGCAAWTKDEGLLFALAASIGFSVYLLLSNSGLRLIRLALLAAGAALPLCVTLYFKLFLAPAQGTWAPLTMSAALHRMVEPARYAQIIKAFWDEGLATGTGIAHPAVCLAVLAVCFGVSRHRLREPVVLACLGVWLVMFAGYFFTYVVTPFDLAWHLSTSVGRLFTQLAPGATFLALAVCRTAEETAIVVAPVEQAARVSRKKARRMSKISHKRQA